MALLVGLFEATAGNAEFRRQVATPNVPRFAALLVVLAEKSSDEGVKVCYSILFPNTGVYHHNDGDVGYVPRDPRAYGPVVPNTPPPARLADDSRLLGKFTGVVPRSRSQGEGSPLRAAVGGAPSPRWESRCRGCMAIARG